MRWKRFSSIVRLRRLAAVAGTIAAIVGAAPPAHATDHMYFAAVDNVTNVLVQRINAETVRLDIATWYLSEHAVSIAIANRFAAGVPVRLIGDRGAIFEADAHTKTEFYWLASQGVPIRLRVNPTWFPEAMHWKAAIFAGQNAVLFGSGNFAPNELAPFSSTNYCDETHLLTTDPQIVGAFKTKFDVMWNDTTLEPESIVGGPPYLKNWNDACTTEPTGCDYFTQYPNPAPMTIDTRRLEPNNPLPADLIWGQGSDFNNRLTQEINNENTHIDLVIYRFGVDNITQALLDKKTAGVPIRLIVDKDQYTNPLYPEYWLTHANVDRLWAAGIPVVQRNHAGCTHMKTLVTTTYATNASSNFTPNWQRDNDYFIAASAKPTVYQAIRDRFQTMWADSSGFGPLVTTPPNAANLASPMNGSAGVATTTSLTWSIAAFAVSYDVYLGTSPSTMSLAGNVPAVMTPSPPATYAFTPSFPLQGATTYYWKVVSRTNATPVNPNMIATSATSSFTTASGGGGGGGGALPSPWTDQDVGATGAAGSASYANGVFTVNGAGTIWGTSDSFHFVQQPFTGDVTLVARVASIQNTNTYAKAGLMIRASNAADAAHVILDIRPTGDYEFMIRPTSGAQTTYLAGALHTPPAWVRLIRSGTTVTAAASTDGSTWTTIGSTTLSIGSSALVGPVVCSVAANTLNTSTFDNVSVTAGSGGGGGTAPNVVIYASDLSTANLHGALSLASDSTSPNGIKVIGPNSGVANTASASANPTDYLDVTFQAQAGTPYTVWLRLQALNNDKFNDSVWVQFSGAIAGGSSAYAIGSTSGLLVNLATDSSGGSLNGWGWQNKAYWLTQTTTVSFNASGAHTIRIQTREDGWQVDQIVLSPTTYLNAAPGGPTNDHTIVAKP